jgi:SAM-dependent methyltransferase
MSASTDQAKDALVERLMKSVGGAFDIFAIHIGTRLGYYTTLAGAGSLTSVELAARTETQERYAREWLEQQTVTGILSVEDETAAPKERRYSLPGGHVEVLTDTESLDYMAPLAQLLVGAVSPLPALLKAYRQGGGVPYADYGRDLLEGQAAMNRTMFLNLLGKEWLPQVGDVHARLSSDEPARVADFGCGAGWSAIGIAHAYPNARVDGFDLDEPSVAMAQGHVEAAGLTDRVTVACRDAGDDALAGQYDLVTAFECVHDMSDPVAALKVMHKLAGETGAVIVADERVAEEFTAEGNEVEWMMYGWSVLHCLPVGMADHPSVGTGTVMRPGTLAGYAREAGFREVEVLPIENFFFRFYRLRQ